MGNRRPPPFRRKLSKPGLLKVARGFFSGLPDEVRGRKYELTDYLMSALAMFLLKSPSLLQFDKEARKPGPLQENLKRMFDLQEVPCDSAVRTRLDREDPILLQGVLSAVHRVLQRGNCLQKMRCVGGRCLLSIDGTGIHSSRSVKCSNCCSREHQNGHVEYYHQTVVAALVHPNRKAALPLAMEPVRRQDGVEKNDCEASAVKRLIPRVRKAHPRLPIVVLADGLASKGPYIDTVKSAGWSFLLGAKPNDHLSLFKLLETSPEIRRTTVCDPDGTVHEFEHLCGVPLNLSRPDLLVNVIRYQEIPPKGNSKVFSWATDLDLDDRSLMEIMRAGRSRWRIENEVFNVMKNNGSHLDRNFGHGHENLCDVFSVLMLATHLIDEVERSFCRVYRTLREVVRTRRQYNHKIREAVDLLLFDGWNSLYAFMMRKDARGVSFPDTS